MTKEKTDDHLDTLYREMKYLCSEAALATNDTIAVQNTMIWVLLYIEAEWGQCELRDLLNRITALVEDAIGDEDNPSGE